MAAGKKVWGIDLGQCALKALCLRADGDTIEVVDHLYVEHERILSQPEVDRKGMIESAMKSFIDKHELGKDDLVVGVPGQHTLSRFSKLPPVDKKKIPEIVKYEAQQQIPFDMDEVIWDYQVFEDPEASEMEVGIFAMRRELLRDQLFFLSDQNLEPKVVQANPLALYNALKFDGIIPENEPMVIVDIGAQNTDLVVANKRSLWTRNIPLGGNNFTEALMKTFKLSFRKAENLKRNAGSHKYARQIFQAMRPVFADLVAEIQRSLGFYTSSRRGIKLKKIVGMGNAFKLPGMVKFVQQNLSMEVIRPNAYKRLAAGDAPRAPELIDRLLSFGVAYGLALQGLNRGIITSNLLPPEIAKQVIWRKKVPMFYASAASLLLAAGVIWARNIMDTNTIETMRGNGVEARYTPQGEEGEIPEPDRQAVQQLQDGPPENTPLLYAMNVKALGEHFGEVLDVIERTITAERNAVQDIAGLQDHKATWPRILQLINDALPAPDPALNEAIWSGSETLRQRINAEPQKYARDKREVVFIEKLETIHSTDVMSEYQNQLRRSSGASAGSGDFSTGRAGAGRFGAGQAAPPGGPSREGFVILIEGTTPNGEGYTFLEEKFIKRLVSTSQAYETIHVPQADFYGIICRRIRELSGGSAGRAGDSGLLDPVTGESMDNDWRFQIAFPVIVGEPPTQTAATGGPGAPGAPGGESPF